MKIDCKDIKTAFLLCSQIEYQDIPEEVNIEHSFSATFSQKMRDLCHNSEKASWRCWNIYRRRVILIAVIIAMLATLAACTPIIKKLYIEYFFVDHGTHYGITFDPEQAAAAPDKCEAYYIPQWSPDGNEPVIKDASANEVVYIWTYKNGGAISYCQLPLPRNPTNSTWMGIDAESSERSSRQINGYKVELFEDKENSYLMALWTDNSYLYTIEISPTDKNSLDTVKTIMDSLVAVDPAEYEG